ncbi:hypothetical protein BLA29_014517 [Euroglyphus maynei]|uniref:Uncharacterized protein n=1 Tax=Euroglyphus maynei TaxID=6958 RepID=A0A1Y3BT39_EURMA|nr:hypothetical protein BLA29_014517 [Euroglyphus maynei]
MKNIPHWNNIDDDDYVEEEEEDEEELDLVDNIQPFNDSITLSSKLELDYWKRQTIIVVQHICQWKNHRTINK